MPSSSASTNTATSSTRIPSQAGPLSASSWTPEPIRVLFSHFPLQTLPANPLPNRTLPLAFRRKHTLFIFTTACADSPDASQIPSFNPSCLKWQTYLLMHRVSFGIQPSNNHASPSGSLPFLISSEILASISTSKETSKSTISVGNTIPAGSLQSWILQSAEHTTQSSEGDETLRLRESAFTTLLESKVRPAWLHAFYLTANLYSLAAPLYIYSTTTSSILRMWQTMQLRAAAQTEVKKALPAMDLDMLYDGVEKALETLEKALGDEEWFSGREQPCLLDAAVFGYTCLLHDVTLGEEVEGRWSKDDGSQRLRDITQQFVRLRDHQQRILDRYYFVDRTAL